MKKNLKRRPAPRRRPGPCRRPPAAEVLVLCVPAGEGFSVLPGSLLTDCARCGKQVWVHGGTADDPRVAGRPYRTVCLSCPTPAELGAFTREAPR